MGSDETRNPHYVVPVDSISIHPTDLLEEVLRFARSFARSLDAACNCRSAISSVPGLTPVELTIGRDAPYSLAMAVCDLNISATDEHYAILKIDEGDLLQGYATDTGEDNLFDCYFRVDFALEAIARQDVTGFRFLKFMAMVDKQMPPSHALRLAADLIWKSSQP